jgi:iron-sulfur cluster repair protein YtfE (RIC family)
MTESSWQANRSAPDGRVRAKVHQIVTEHGVISAEIKTVRELRMRLIADDDMAPPLRAVLESIAALEAHLHEYMFLENCILLPRAIAMQEQMATA